MKLLKYQRMQQVNIGTDDAPQMKDVFYNHSNLCSEIEYPAKLTTAQAEAYNGEVTVEDVPDVPQAPAQLDAVEAQATYTAMMTNTMLEG